MATMVAVIMAAATTAGGATEMTSGTEEIAIFVDSEAKDFTAVEAVNFEVAEAANSVVTGDFTAVEVSTVVVPMEAELLMEADTGKAPEFSR